MLMFFSIDMLEAMDLEEGKMLCKKLIPIAMGQKLPNRSNPYEWITYDVFTSMRACDKELADQVFQGVLDFITGQVDSRRLTCSDMGSLLRQRMREAGAS